MATVASTKSASAVRFLRVPNAAKWLVHLILITVAILWLEPSIGLLITSLRPRGDISSSGWWNMFFQPHVTLQNYDAVLSAQGMGNAFLNSFKITIPSTILPVLVASLAAYALAWVNFRGKDALFVLIITLMVVPIQTTLVPVLQIFNQVGLTGSYLGIWLAHTGYGLPFAIYLLRNFFAGLPKELLESSRIDGASDLVVFLRIIVPLSVPALASLAIFQFMWVWNDLLIALVFMSSPDTQPMTVRMQAMLGTYASEWDIMSASAFISMVVPLIVFFALQRYFVTGITAGAVKE
jgi:alpha-glucoside transport system permease protein